MGFIPLLPPVGINFSIFVVDPLKPLIFFYDPFIRTKRKFEALKVMAANTGVSKKKREIIRRGNMDNWKARLDSKCFRLLPYNLT